MNSEINYVSPFKKFCISIGNLPTAYLESMSYYEGLTYLVNYLSNNVIPALNNNGLVVEELQEKFIELKNFVDTYFENLDVQEEVNVKLDEMAESGELTDIIAQYLGLAGMITFDTVADMKLAENLVNGSKCTTLGYNSVNDGGTAIYQIRTILNTDVIDEMNIIALYNQNLVAELIIKDNSINLSQCGIFADNTDVTSKLNTLFTNIQNKEITNINFQSEQTYVIEGQVNITGNYIINGNNATIKFLTKPANNNLHVFDITADNIEIRDLNIDGSEIDQDQWDSVYASDLNIRRIFYITSKNIVIENVNIINVWGNGLQLYGYDNVTIQNCNFDKIGGGYYTTDPQTGENDFFGDGIYLGYHDNEARVDIDNIYFNGYVSTNDGKGSRAGIVFENLNVDHQTPGKTYVNVNNYALLNFNRALHWENYKSDTVIHLSNGEITQDCSIRQVSDENVELYIDKSTINHTTKTYNGSHSFRGFKTIIQDSIINIDTNAEFILCQGNETDITYKNCTINNINKTSINQGVCKFYDSIININNSISSHLVYSADVEFHNCIFNNSTSSDKSLSKSGSQIKAYSCEFNNINPYVILKDTKSVFKFANALNTMADYGRLANSTIYVNNTLMYTPHIGFTYTASDLINFNNVTAAKSFGDSATVPLIPNPLPNDFNWKCSAKYMMYVTGANNDDILYNQKFRNACYYVTIVTNVDGTPSVSGAIQTSPSAPSGYNRALDFDTGNGTISKTADHSGSVNRVFYWIIPYGYTDSAQF